MRFISTTLNLEWENFWLAVLLLNNTLLNFFKISVNLLPSRFSSWFRIKITWIYINNIQKIRITGFFFHGFSWIRRPVSIPCPLYTKFGLSWNFLVKLKFFIHIKVVPIIYEWGKVERVLGNKTGITIYSWTVWMHQIKSACLRNLSM